MFYIYIYIYIHIYNKVNLDLEITSFDTLSHIHTHTHAHTHICYAASLARLRCSLVWLRRSLVFSKTKDFLHTHILSHTHTPLLTHILTCVLNRKSDTYVSLNILLGIRHAVNRHLQVGTRQSKLSDSTRTIDYTHLNHFSKIVFYF